MAEKSDNFFLHLELVGDVFSGSKQAANLFGLDLVREQNVLSVFEYKRSILSDKNFFFHIC